jgi:hypothetical protein
MYYDGYGYNFYYGDYDYYEYSVNDARASRMGIGAVLGIVIPLVFCLLICCVVCCGRSKGD